MSRSRAARKAATGRTPRYSHRQVALLPTATAYYRHRHLLQSEYRCFVDRQATPLQHPDIGQYFGGFDPQRGYVPRAELAALYPDG